MPRPCDRRRGVVAGRVDGVTGGRNLSRAPPSDTRARDAAAATETRRRRTHEAEVRELNIKIIERRLEQPACDMHRVARNALKIENETTHVIARWPRVVSVK